MHPCRSWLVTGRIGLDNKMSRYMRIFQTLLLPLTQQVMTLCTCKDTLCTSGPDHVEMVPGWAMGSCLEKDQELFGSTMRLLVQKLAFFWCCRCLCSVQLFLP